MATFGSAKFLSRIPPQPCAASVARTAGTPLIAAQIDVFEAYLEHETLRDEKYTFTG